MIKLQIEKIILIILLSTLVIGPLIQNSHAFDFVVKEAQIRLSEKGYNPGPSDGLLGDKTVKAIREFQTATLFQKQGSWTRKQ